jgi:hypothetical protein
LSPSPSTDELTLTVVVRGATASADVVRLVNVALGLPGATDIRITRKD